MERSGRNRYSTNPAMRVAVQPAQPRNDRQSRTNQPRPEPFKAQTRVKKRGGRLKSWLFILVLLCVIIALSPFVIVQLINNTNESRIYTSIDATPSRPVAIVFGAGLNRNGTPSPMLADRLDSAIELYKNGKVQRLLMSGDDVTSVEVTSMKNYAIKHGVPAGAIIADTAGLRTYDTCYRATHNFGINQAVLVTQGYHLPRALYLCNSLGVESVGFKAGRDNYPNQDYYNSREFMATFLSWVDVTFTQPTPEITRMPESGGR
ncbi:MAG TPA: ElyC/SanA/YdcF family protein [Chloroflexia bacterium]|nr:ElyC/SanA/YdcF family protein [Chloroflexia bacterium]